MEEYGSLTCSLLFLCLKAWCLISCFSTHQHFCIYFFVGLRSRSRPRPPSLSVSLSLIIHKLTSQILPPWVSPSLSPTRSPTFHAYFRPSTPRSPPLPPTKSHQHLPPAALYNAQPRVPHLTSPLFSVDRPAPSPYT